MLQNQAHEKNIKSKHGIIYYLQGYLYIAPAMVLLLLVTIYPVVRTIQLSFSNWDFNTFSTNWAGFSNFAKLFSDSWIAIAFNNTLIFTVASVVLHTLIAWALALLIYQGWKSTWLRNIVRGLWILPWLFSTAAAALMWGLLYHPFGFLNYFLIHTGLSKIPVDFLGNPNNALAALINVNVWKTYPIYLVLLLGALQSVSEDLIEAAKLDGAGRWMIFRHVILPTVTPSLLTMITLDFITTFGTFDLVRIMTGGGPMRATETLSFYIYRTAFKSADFTYSSAISVLMFVFLSVLSLVYIKLYLRCDKQCR